MKSAGAGAKCDHFKLGVRTLIWTCEVRACDPKKGPNSHLAHFLTQVVIMIIWES
jgi:hypothetical protein